MWNLYENCYWSREILSFRWSFSALGNICQMMGKIGFVSVIINESVSRMLILFCWPAFVFIGLVLDMNTRLPFACEFTVPYLVCVIERSMFFKDLKLESDFFFSLCHYCYKWQFLHHLCSCSFFSIFQATRSTTKNEPWQFNSRQLISSYLGSGSPHH